MVTTFFLGFLVGVMSILIGSLWVERGERRRLRRVLASVDRKIRQKRKRHEKNKN